MSHSQFQSKGFILRLAWLSLWDERMTTGRINQVAIIWAKRRNISTFGHLGAPKTAIIDLCCGYNHQNTVKNQASPPCRCKSGAQSQWLTASVAIFMHVPTQNRQKKLPREPFWQYPGLKCDVFRQFKANPWHWRTHSTHPIVFHCCAERNNMPKHPQIQKSA